MQRSTVKTLELTTAGKFAEVECHDMTDGRVQARLAQGTPWGGAVIGFYGACSDDRPQFDELDPTNRLSAEGISAVINLKGVRRLRVFVITASGTSTALVETSVCVQNPSLTGGGGPAFGGSGGGSDAAP